MIKGRISNRIESFKSAEEAKKERVYFYFREIISELDTEVVLAGNRRVLMLGSNSYMGLTNHPEVKEAAVNAIGKYGTGCAGSRFLNGTFDIHIELERELAGWVGKESAMLFATGFQTSLGAVAGLLHRHDYIIMDMNNHASIVDGARLCMARPMRYPHNDMSILENVLTEIPIEKGKLIVSDGVFSMEGDIVNLPEAVELSRKYDAVLMIDDAHGLGVLGPEGSGTAAHFGLTDRVDFIMGTFSKSLASQGGFLAADQKSIEYLKHHARPFIFSASMPHSAAAAALAALRIVRREPERIDRLWANTRIIRDGLESLGYHTGSSTTPIIPVYIGDAYTLMLMCRRLEEEGIFINPVIPPAVPPNRCLIRISLMATHTESQILFALDILEKVGKELGIIS